MAARVHPHRGRTRKVCLRDSGLLHQLLAIADPAALALHPKSGASWEGFAIEQVLRIARPDEAYCWATHAGVDLGLEALYDVHPGGRRYHLADHIEAVPLQALLP